MDSCLSPRSSHEELGRKERLGNGRTTSDVRNLTVGPPSTKPGMKRQVQVESTVEGDGKWWVLDRSGLRYITSCRVSPIVGAERRPKK